MRTLFWRVYELHKGRHLLIDCRGVDRAVCLDDGRVLEALATAARRAGANVLSQVRYHFGHNSPPGFAVMILLDESHCSAHSYADLGLIAMDIFTCGDTDPQDILDYLTHEIPLGQIEVRDVPRFPTQTPQPKPELSNAVVA